MKKVLISLALSCSFLLAFAEPIDDLEQAIKKGNIPQVKSLLQTTALSDADFVSLIDLAQQSITFNEGQLKCLKITFGLAESPFKQLFSCFGGCVSAFAFILIFSEVYAQCKFTGFRPLMIPATGIPLASSIFLFHYLLKLRTQAYKKWQNAFDDTVTVKQLLLRHKNKNRPNTVLG